MIYAVFLDAGYVASMEPALRGYLKEYNGLPYINASALDNTGSHLGVVVRGEKLEMQLLLPAHVITLVLSSADEKAVGFLAS